jgi:hypothetical protein
MEKRNGALFLPRREEIYCQPAIVILIIESINIALSIKSISEWNVDNETTTIGSRVNNYRYPPRTSNRGTWQMRYCGDAGTVQLIVNF